MRGYGCWAKSAVAMMSQWSLYKSLIERKSQCLLWNSLVADWLLCKFTGRLWEVMAVGQSRRSLGWVSGRYRSYWLKGKVNVCYGTHWLLSKFTDCYANSLDAYERLWLLGKVGGRYDESVVTIQVIDWKKKSMFAMELIGCSLVAMQIHWSLMRGYRCWAKSAVAMMCQWAL
jgi:hypothetical protein